MLTVFANLLIAVTQHGDPLGTMVAVANSSCVWHAGRMFPIC